jgi:SET domain-containing protein
MNLPPRTLSVQVTKNKGRGVFATTNIRGGKLIESCEVIVIPAAERKVLDSTILYDYYFEWGSEDSAAAIALGNGSLYNHSYSPNAQYVRYLDAQRIDFVALCDIVSGEEITVNYNGEPLDSRPIWFMPAPEEA